MMPYFLVRARETRVHYFRVEASDEAAAKEIVDDMDGSQSESDTFDQWEVMDAAEDDDQGDPRTPQYGVAP